MRVVEIEGFRARRAQFDRAPVVEACVTAIAVGDGPYLMRYPGGWGFMWECPGCGHAYSGEIADEPVSGWDEPRWTWVEDENGLTLAPSLGCPDWRAGRCVGHWWVRSGRMVLA